MLNKRLGILVAVTTLMITGCSSPGSDSASKANTADAINSPVTVEEVAELGDITLDVWADAGDLWRSAHQDPDAGASGKPGSRPYWWRS